MVILKSQSKEDEDSNFTFKIDKQPSDSCMMIKKSGEIMLTRFCFGFDVHSKKFHSYLANRNSIMF